MAESGGECSPGNKVKDCPHSEPALLESETQFQKSTGFETLVFLEAPSPEGQSDAVLHGQLVEALHQGPCISRAFAFHQPKLTGI